MILKISILLALLLSRFFAQEVIEMNISKRENSQKQRVIFQFEHEKNGTIEEVLKDKNSSTPPKPTEKNITKEPENDSTTKSKPEPQKMPQSLKFLRQELIELEQNSTKTREENITKEPKPEIRESNTTKPAPKKSPKKPKLEPKSKPKAKPKKAKRREIKKQRAKKFIRGKEPVVVIIIDDVSTKKQIREIQALPFKVTPSIFPPSNMSMRSHLLARGLNHFMVHLPMQSPSHKMNRFKKTLMIYDSRAKIRRRIQEIRRLFPRAKFINNHTGSTFTANYQASKKLYQELMREGFIFVDSKTSGRSKMRKIAREFGRAYIYRDIFLDNIQSVEATLKELRRGVKIAQKKGFAIIIGHPHPTTIRALRRAEGILRGVKTLYIDEFYRWRFR